LPVEPGAQVLEGHAPEGWELEVSEHPGKDVAAAELDPLLDPHPGEGLDDLDPADGHDHLLLERLLDGFGAREHPPVYGAHDRDLRHTELDGVEDLAHLLAGRRHVRRVGREGDVQRDLAPPYLGDRVPQSVAQPGDDRLARGVVVGDHRPFGLA
jgi:hypothetical protein